MAGGGGADGGEAVVWEKRAMLEKTIKFNFTLQGYIRMAVTVLAYLTFTWSTAVLLGGYVGSLQKKDFQCLTVITVIEATIIFNELESHGNVKLDIRNEILGAVDPTRNGVFELLNPRVPFMSIGKRVLFFPFTALLVVPVFVMISILTLFYTIGPFICIGLSSWRLRFRDYGASSGGASLANLTTALNFFYSLALCQGVLYYFLLILVEYENDFIGLFHELFKLSEERVSKLSEERVSKLSEERDRRSIEKYLQDIREKCARDPALAERRSLLSFAVEQLDSESQEDYLLGARMLDMLINDGEDARTLILRSRRKMQRLLDTLGHGSGDDDDVEIRGLAARIVADLADGIHLAHFPGAIWSVSSLLETTGYHALWNNVYYQHELSRSRAESQRSVQQEIDRTRAQIMSLFPERLKPLIHKIILGIEERPSAIIQQEVWPYLREKILRRKPETGDDGVQAQQLNKQVDHAAGVGGGCNQLIVQGLSILEKLARDPQNRRDLRRSGAPRQDHGATLLLHADPRHWQQ